MSILDQLIEENEFPIVFLGSGMSKRFLTNFPNWNGLLEEFWEKIGLNNFYGRLNNIRSEIKKENPELVSNEIEIDHFAYMKIGSIIEEKFNRDFNDGKITIDGFSPKDAHQLKISPFKKAISEHFRKYKYKDGVERELKLFKNMLLKTQIILTTNYDTFIEDLYNQASDIDKYIGQKGFFKNTYGYSEIYKIHGCVESPNDIVITKDDYDKFNQNSVLISSKIISMLINSPIIFLGYSLTDTNVRGIIKDFTRSLTDDEVHFLENKLVVIERKEGEHDLVEEVVDDRDLGCKVRVIKTDNYELVFRKIGAINQGIAPSAVRKYQHVIKELIIDRGKKGALNTVLVSPEDIDNLNEKFKHKNITVAIGDSKYIFQIPDIVTYSLDYISDEDQISTDTRMRFALMQISNAPKSRFSINKILDQSLIKKSDLHGSEKEKLIQKIDHFSDFDLIIIPRK